MREWQRHPRWRSVALDDSDVNPWGAGLGLSLGYTTWSAVYLGGVFDYFFGEEQSELGITVRANVWQLAAEGGYDFQVGDGVVLRPKLGLGLATANATVECSMCGIESESTSESEFAAAPGVTAMFFPGSVLINVDARYQMVFAEPEMVDALILSAGIGF